MQPRTSFIHIQNKKTFTHPHKKNISMHTFRHLLAAALLLLSVSLLCAQGLMGEVTKQGAGNPSLGVTSFSGTAGARTALEGTLKRCDWFSVLPEARASSAAIKVEASYKSQPKHAYSLRVTPAGMAPLTLSGEDETLEAAAGKAVDALLKALFNVPALCSAPIAYALHGQKNMKELFTCTLAGGKARRLTHNNAISTEPSWGHAGALVYTLNANNALSVVLVDIARNRQRVVSKAKGLNSSAALSRDGRYVAIPLSLGQQIDLYLIDLKDGSRRQLTKDRNVESSPVFSPDCRSICYVSDKSGRPQLYIMSLADGAVRRLQLGGSECVSPDWSAVSNKLCFAQRVASGKYVVSVLDLNVQDAAPEVVTDAAGNWEAPSWAPDGRHIVCTRQSGGKQDLYVVDSRYRAFHQLTSGSRVSLPAWAPAR